MELWFMENFELWVNVWFPIIAIVVSGAILSILGFLTKRLCENRRMNKERIDKVIKSQETLITQNDKMAHFLGTTYYVSMATKDALIKGTNGDGIIYKKSIKDFEATHKQTLTRLEFPYYED